MKGERRHELQQNDLLAWVNDFVEGIKPYLTLILLLLVLGSLSLAGWTYWSGQSSEEAAYAWDDLINAMDSGGPVEINEVAEQRPDSDVAQWAAVISGDMYLQAGCQQLFTSKASAAQELRKAVDQYLAVLETSRNSALRERATFGLARAYESLAGSRQSAGELDKAVEYYQQVVEAWPQGAYAQASTRRIEDLDRQSTKAFYDRFAQYDPQPTYDDLPDTGVEGPKFDLDSLDENTVSDFSDIMNFNLDDWEAEKADGSDDETPSDSSDDGTPPEDSDDGTPSDNSDVGTPSNGSDSGTSPDDASEPEDAGDASAPGPATDAPAE